jgi:methionine synthase I (cobalamin-dependent)
MKSRTKATKEIEQYLSACEPNIKSLIDKGVDVWIIQVTRDILNIVEKCYKIEDKK